MEMSKTGPKLRNDSKFHNVYISPDLHLKETQVKKKLYLELKVAGRKVKRSDD